MRKEAPILTNISDWVDINGRSFNCCLTLSPKFGVASAMNGGRILEFLLTEDGSILGYWKDCEWQDKIPDMDAEAYVASLYFIHKYNRKVNETVERSSRKHEHQC